MTDSDQVVRPFINTENGIPGKINIVDIADNRFIRQHGSKTQTSVGRTQTKKMIYHERTIPLGELFDENNRPIFHKRFPTFSWHPDEGPEADSSQRHYGVACFLPTSIFLIGPNRMALTASAAASARALCKARGISSEASSID